MDQAKVWSPKLDLEDCFAEYTDPINAEFRGNPLIEALPPIMETADFYEAVTYYPIVDEAERSYSRGNRLQCVMKILKYFQPTPRHNELEEKISRVLRYGYLARNPLLPQFKKRLRELKKSLLKEVAGEKEALEHLIANEDVAVSGFTMIGVSGVGKTTALKKILKLYPQVIVHSEYKGTLLNFYQIVWIKIDCPHGGSIKDLCVEFFEEIDRLLGTNYKNLHGNKSNPDYLMLSKMCQIAYGHCIGMIVIDEIQNLDQAKGGGIEQMLNFFVRLDNKIGVPILTVGTNKATKILQGAFRQGRRREGPGSVYWERFKVNTEDEKELWNFFVEQLFEYQWTEEIAEFDEEFSNVLYDQSQGVTDIAVKLYMLTQFRVMTSFKHKKITPPLMQQVAQDNLILVKPMLDALRSGVPERIAKYSDINPIDIGDFYEKYKAKLNIEEQKKLERLRKEFKNNLSKSPEISQIISGLLDLEIPPKLAKNFAEQVSSQREPKDTVVKLIERAYRLALTSPTNIENEKSKKEDEPKLKKLTKKLVVDDLRILFSEAKLSKISTYEGLKNSGVIKSPIDEFTIA